MKTWGMKGISRSILPGILSLILLWAAPNPTMAANGTGFSPERDWVQAATGVFDASAFHAAVVYGPRIFKIGGRNGAILSDVWSSPDGTNWRQETAMAAFGPRYSHESVVYGEKMWLIAGSDSTGKKNDVWFSTDGVNWTQATADGGFPVRDGFIALSYAGRIWIIGGNGSSGVLNDVWSSTDGATWTQVTSDGGFGDLVNRSPAGVVFDKKMWVFGCDGGNCLNPVWYSEDGVTWTQTTENAPYGPIHGMEAVAYRGYMVITGGANLGIRDSETWYSKDGSTWAKMTGVEYSPRSNHGSVVLNDKMWVIGGKGEGGIALNDVWYNGPDTGIQIRERSGNR